MLLSTYMYMELYYAVLTGDGNMTLVLNMSTATAYNYMYCINIVFILIVVLGLLAFGNSSEPSL